MPDGDDQRTLQGLEAELNLRTFTTWAFTAHAAAEHVSWLAVLVFADVTAVLAFLTGVFAANGALAFASFLAGCALLFLHTARMKR
ncbi:hypothetical protein AB0F91_40150 [Amycolatopsis sp. NPDC023774]|uniref:hypothetical protein n=1 Tax=Amycolatopsis sp. NPDC023774 TaxID=3155015 RepID=UPI0033FD5475